MEYMVVWLHDFADTYYSVHGFDQVDDAEAFYQKLSTNNPNIFSCLGKVEIVEQKYASSAIFDPLPGPSRNRASGTEDDHAKKRLIQGQAAGEAVCMVVYKVGRGSFYRIQAFEHVEDAVAFFHRGTIIPGMFMCVVKFEVLQLRNRAAKGHNA